MFADQVKLGRVRAADQLLDLSCVKITLRMLSWHEKLLRKVGGIPKL